MLLGMLVALNAGAASTITFDNQSSKPALVKMVGSATVTSSEYEITGLTRGNQYWVRVRAVRASMTGHWSDQATRVANI